MKAFRMKITLLICLSLIIALGGGFMLTHASYNRTTYAAAAGTQIKIELSHADNRSAITIVEKLLNNDKIILTQGDGEAFDAFFTGKTVDKGTAITISASSNALYTFEDFVMDGVTVTPESVEGNPEVLVSGERLVLLMEETSRNITINFSTVPFNVFVQGFYKDSPKSVKVANNVTLSANQIEAGDNLCLTFKPISNVNLHSIGIKKGNSESFTTFEASDLRVVADGATSYVLNQFFSTPFLWDHHFNRDITIVLYFTDLFSLDVEIVTGVGAYEVWRKGASSPTTDRYFGYGEQLEVRAKNVPGSFYSYAQPNAMARNITIATNTTVYLNFRADEMTIRPNSNKKFSFSRSTFTIDQTLHIVYDLPSSRRIKEWKIDGKKYSKYGKTGDITLSGNTLTIILSKEVLSNSNLWKDGELVIPNKVDDSFKESMLLLIGGVGVIIPLLAVVALFLFIKDARRKKFIKEQLAEKRVEGIKRDVGGYISNLRDGKDDGKISKQAIKQALKEGKAKKKESKQVPATPVPKPAAPKPTPIAPKPVPAPVPSATVPPRPATTTFTPPPTPSAPVISQTQQIIEMLCNSVLKPDMTIVKNGAIIATLQKDRTIIDRAGRQIATARLEDGALIDKENKVVGKVTGNGTIARP